MKDGPDGRTTVVLTSRANFVWLSMQEIIPSLERIWMNTHIDGVHQVKIVNLDEKLSESSFFDIISADQIVVVCFTVPVCRLLALLRCQMQLNQRYVIYLYSQATIACWPYRHYGLTDFRTSDIFVASSKGDASCLLLSLPDARTEVIPFTIQWPPELIIPKMTFSLNRRLQFVFVGRITAQKNLHTLLLSLARWRDETDAKDWILDIFGQEDGMGSPNMGIKEEGYLKYLEYLVDQLDLKENLRFHGFVQREIIETQTKNVPYIFLSLSLHSDENFGMAAFRSLINGNQCVLSSWGGHQDFVDHFPDQVELVKVKASSQGPWIDLNDVVIAIKNAIARFKSKENYALPEYYDERIISEKLKRLCMEDFQYGTGLRFTELSDEILKRRTKNFADDDRQMRIFHSYEDPLAHRFFERYGMS